MPKTILFRVEAGPEVGFGHLVRSVSIASKIRIKRPDCHLVFLTSDHSDSTDYLKKYEFDFICKGSRTEEAFILEMVKELDAQALFIDKLYNYSVNFIRSLREVLKVVMLHNYCDGGHMANAYIFPQAHMEMKLVEDPRWANAGTELYHGFKYVILNDAIAAILPKPFDGEPIKNIAITTGGSDPKAVMIKLLRLINQIDLKGIEVKALVGKSFVHRDALEEVRKGLGDHIEIVPFDIEHLGSADLAISTFGVSTYELLYLGLNVLSVGHVEQNALGSKILSQQCRKVIDLGNIEVLDKDLLEAQLKYAIDNHSNLHHEKCELDGLGADRVAGIICNNL